MILKGFLHRKFCYEIFWYVLELCRNPFNNLAFWARKIYAIGSTETIFSFLFLPHMSEKDSEGEAGVNMVQKSQHGEWPIVHVWCYLHDTIKTKVVFFGACAHEFSEPELRILITITIHRSMLSQIIWWCRK